MSGAGGVGRARFRPQHLTLIPILAGSRAVFDIFDGPTAGIAYAVPGFGHMWNAAASDSRVDLASKILGLRRAAILRFLHQPATGERVGSRGRALTEFGLGPV